MKDNQLIALWREGIPKRHRIDAGLYFRVIKPQKATWVLRYTFAGARKEFTIDNYGVPPSGIKCSLARERAAVLKSQIRAGIDPKLEKKRPSLLDFQTVDDLAKDWLSVISKRLKHPSIPERVYFKDISPHIGELSVDKVEPRDIANILRSINDSGRPTISNDALGYLKQLFKHGVKLGTIHSNPASAFDIIDAGGKESPRKRSLSDKEIKVLFSAMRQYKDMFVRENYLAITLLLLLGVRKTELTAAKLEEFDLVNGVWHLSESRSKNGIPIDIPLSRKAVDIIKELSFRACQSEYLFPNRRASKRNPYISPDTLNSALKKLLKQSDVSIDHLTIHDLRRTFRTKLSEIGVPPHIAERCMNHKLPKIMDTYDKHDYFEERKDAYDRLLEQLSDLIF